MDRKRKAAVLCMVIGVLILLIPVYYHYKGMNDTNQLMEDFTKAVEEKQDEEKTREIEEQTAGRSADAAIFAQGDVIAILEIEALGIRYPVLEGAGSDNLNIGIGHLTETAGIGKQGNCVLAGHNGSRHGEFFTHLNDIAAGDTVTLLDADGAIYTYVVEETDTVGPYDNSIKNQEEDRELTLFTCAQSGTMRFVVKCAFIGEVRQ